MIRTVTTLSLFFAFCGCLLAQEQDFTQPAKGSKEHLFLKKFVGKWESETKGSMGEGQPEMSCKGTMNSEMLGEIWLINHNEMEIPGMPMRGIQTIGFDTEKNKYVGTWVDSMMNHMWKYEGTLDEGGKKLTLEADGPNFATGKGTTKFRDAYEFQDADTIIATSTMQGEDGKWITIMTGKMTRIK